MKREIQSERKQLLKRLENFFEVPLIVLGFIWLVLLIIELVYGISPALETIGIVIWIIFIADFAIKFFIATNKGAYLKSNVVTIVSLIVPAFRIFRIIRLLRLLRLTRGLRLIKIIGSVNRGMRALSSTMQRRAFGYVVTLSVIVLFAGAAGMYAFESNIEGGLNDYGSSLWWTGMILTTMGSEYWPRTAEGRILCIILALYSFAVFGYFTAALASFFVGGDSSQNEDVKSQIKLLRKEIAEMKGMLKVSYPEREDGDEMSQ